MVGSARMAMDLGQEFQAAIVEPDIKPVQFLGRNHHANTIARPNVTLRREHGLCYGKMLVLLNADPERHPLIAFATNRAQMRMHSRDAVARERHGRYIHQNAHSGMADGGPTIAPTEIWN
ncbi:UDP-N-acetylmuramoyl-tripeptide--D-alanyl-D-alanine ligase [Mesorhizobium loti]|nr:UDP-N-acetylmuramoyl-tripeptide--D-alanyl-D-alanine ligase [Mesorhizobium loti]